MRKEKSKILIWITSISAMVGISLSVYAYFIEKSSMGNLAGAVLAIVSLIGTLITVIGHNKNKTVQLDFETATKLADERLKEEIDLRNKTIEALKEELAHKNLPAWEQKVRDYLEKGELQKAIESIDTNSGDEEAAQKHIRKAQLYITNFQFAEAEQHYKQAEAVFPSYDNNFEIADFYYNLNKFPEAIVYYSHCLSLANFPQERAVVFNNMGNMQSKNNAYREAEASYEESLKIYRELAAKNRDAYLPGVAMTLNNLGNLYRNKNEYSTAEASLKESLKIYRELAAKNRDAYLFGVAMTLCNLGLLLGDKNEYSEAEISYKESLKIRRELATKNRDAYLPDVAGTLNNLGILHRNKNEYSEAEISYKESLKIWRELAVKNRDAYLPDVAMTLNNLGNFHWDKNKYSEAEASYKEALKIRRELAAKNRDAYLPDVAMTLNNLGVLHKDKSEYSTAEESLKESLKIRRKLAAKSQDAYLPGVATTLDNLGVLHQRKNEYSEAETYLKEALKIRRKLAVKNQDAYLPVVAETLVNLSEFYLNGVSNEKLSLQYAGEAMKILGKCNHIPFVQEQLNKAKQVIETWNKNRNFPVHSIVCKT